MKILEHNVESGKVIERNATAAETAQGELDNAKTLQRQTEAEAKATAKAALLTQLGITAEQAKLLLS